MREPGKVAVHERRHKQLLRHSSKPERSSGKYLLKMEGDAGPKTTVARSVEASAPTDAVKTMASLTLRNASDPTLSVADHRLAEDDAQVAQTAQSIFDRQAAGTQHKSSTKTKSSSRDDDGKGATKINGQQPCGAFR